MTEDLGDRHWYCAECSAHFGWQDQDDDLCPWCDVAMEWIVEVKEKDE